MRYHSHKFYEYHMPSVHITKEQLLALAEGATTVWTPQGNVLLEIQGDLEISNVQADHEARLIGDKEVRFGLLCVEGTNATMYIGKKQRLLGTVVELDTPLGVLRFSAPDKKVVLTDIIRSKIIFKDRPLPIM